MRRSLVFQLLLIGFIPFSIVEAQVQGFDTYSWQQKDSVIATLFYGGALNVCDVLIKDAYQAELGKTDKDDRAMAVFSTWQGVRHMAHQQLDSATQFLQEALDIYNEHPAMQDSAYRDVLLNLGDVLSSTGSQEDASILYQRSIAFMDAHEISNKPLYLNSLTGIISLELQMGNHDKAEEFGRKALGFAQNEFGEKTDEYISALTNLGRVYQSKGQSRRASNVILQAYELSKINLPKDHTNRLLYASNAGDIYASLGRQTSEGEVYDEMLQFFEDNPSEQETSLYPMILNRKATWFEAQGNLEEAYDYFNKANILLSLRTERTSAEYIQSEVNMARILRKQEKYLEAEGYYQSALQYAPKLYGEDSWSMAVLHENLGDMYIEMMDYANALKHLQAAVSLFEGHMKDQDPSYAFVLQKLGNAHLKSGLDSLAEDNLAHAQNILVDIYGASHPAVFTNGLKLSKFYWTRNRNKTIDYLRDCKNYALKTLDETLPFLNGPERGFIYQDVQELINLYTSLAVNDGGEMDILDELSEIVAAFKTAKAKTNVAAVATYMGRPSSSFRKDYNAWQQLRKQIIDAKNAPEDAQTEVANLITEAQKLQSNLLPGFKGSGKSDLSAAGVRQLLKSDAVFLDFFSARTYDSESESYDERASFYALLNPGQQSNSKIIELTLNQNALLTSQARNQAAYYEQLWSPIESELTGINELFISAAEDLNRISFSSLPTKDGGFVFDDFKIHRLTSAAGISRRQDPLPSKEAVFFGNPDFSEALDSSMAASQSWLVPMASIGSKKMLDQVRFSSITASESEVRTMASMLDKKKWKTTTFVLGEANKTNFQNSLITGKGIMHLATKFYFLDSDTTGESQFRSGFGLAGAKSGWSSDHATGVVSSLELSSMDLSKFDLAILGYHEVKSGTALASLQGALHAAGVKNTLVSLWDVPSEGRKLFFSLFYKNLTKGQSVSTAFYNTKKKLRKKSDPIIWGGFVLMQG